MINTKIKNLYLSVKQTFPIVVFCFLIIFPVQKVRASEITPENVIQLVNKERLSQGLNALVENSILSRAAQEKLENMIEESYFAHISPSGLSPWYWIEKNGYQYQYAGENLAINFANAENQHQAWMASPTHRKNILNPNYKEIGVAVARGKVEGENSIITVQLFGTRMNLGDSAKNTEKEKQEVAGESAAPQSVSAPIAIGNPITLPFLSEENWLNQNSLEKISSLQPRCANDLCYFNEINSWLNKIKQSSKEAGWILAMFILIIAVVVNTITLSQEKNRNPFIAANTVILLLILMGAMFWQI